MSPNTKQSCTHGSWHWEQAITIIMRYADFPTLGPLGEGVLKRSAQTSSEYLAGRVSRCMMLMRLLLAGSQHDHPRYPKFQRGCGPPAVLAERVGVWEQRGCHHWKRRHSCHHLALYSRKGSSDHDATEKSRIFRCCPSIRPWSPIHQKGLAEIVGLLVTASEVSLGFPCFLLLVYVISCLGSKSTAIWGGKRAP